jgi:hypothetical protein
VTISTENLQNISSNFLFQIYHKAKCPGAVGELICDYCNETGFDTVNILSVHVRVSSF